MSDWKPIESAPKDGTEVLLRLPFGVRIGTWSEYPDASYPQCWQDQEGRALVRGWKDDPEPTQWHPVPA